jgi:flagellar protein FlgJ
VISISASPSAPRSAAAPTEHEQLRDAARQFEAIFVRHLLSTARAANFGGNELFGGAGEDTFRDMQDAHFADLAAKSDMVGLATSIEAQLARFVQQEG